MGGGTLGREKLAAWRESVGGVLEVVDKPEATGGFVERAGLAVVGVRLLEGGEEGYKNGVMSRLLTGLALVIRRKGVGKGVGPHF